MIGRTWAFALVMLALAVGGASACDMLGGGDEAGDDDDGKKKKKKKKASADEDDDEPDEADDEPGEADDEKAKTPEKFEGKTFEVGDTAELAGLDVKLKKVKVCTYKRETQQKALEKKGKMLIAGELIFESTSKKRVAATRQFKAHDEDRIVFKPASLGGSDCQPDLSHTGLATGDKAKGWMGFKVPKDVEGLTLTYEHQPHRKDGEKKKPAKQFAEFELEP